MDAKMQNMSNVRKPVAFMMRVNAWTGQAVAGQDEALECTKHVESLTGYPDYAVQVCEGLVNGCLCIKGLSKELVLQDSFQALLQTVGLLLQAQLVLQHAGRVPLQLLVLPAQCTPSPQQNQKAKCCCSHRLP